MDNIVPPETASGRVAPKHAYEKIAQALRERAHEPDVIATCRIAWALAFSDHPLKGYREISRESGVSDRIVKRILPPEGHTDALGLITCIDQGQASIHADELRAARYALAGDAGDPGTEYPRYLATSSYPSTDQEEGEPSVPGPEEALYPSHCLPGVSSTRVAQPFSPTVMEALRPGVDVWHETGEWAWALAVLTGCSDTQLTLGELRDWTRMSPSGVQKMVRRWEKSDRHIAYRQATPGRPTVVRLMLRTWVLADLGWYADRTCMRDAFLRHNAEIVRHRNRMTEQGHRAKLIARGDITDHDVPAEIVAQGEDIVYKYLTGELEKTSEKLADIAEIVRASKTVPSMLDPEYNEAVRKRREAEAAERAEREAQRAAEDAREQARAREYLETLNARRRADKEAYWAARKAEALELARRPKEPERDPQEEVMARMRERLAA